MIDTSSFLFRTIHSKSCIKIPSVNLICFFCCSIFSLHQHHVYYHNAYSNENTGNPHPPRNDWNHCFWKPNWICNISYHQLYIITLPWNSLTVVTVTNPNPITKYFAGLSFRFSIAVLFRLNSSMHSRKLSHSIITVTNNVVADVMKAADLSSETNHRFI